MTGKFLVALLALPALLASAVTMPSPFTRELEKTESPSTKGQDVVLAQTMLNRNSGINIDVDGWFWSKTEKAVKKFQRQQNFPRRSRSGVIDEDTSNALIACCSADGYVDEGKPASDYDKLFKIAVPLPSANRNIEATASLFDKDNNLKLTFQVRTHGHNNDGTGAFPDFTNDAGCSQISGNCNTPTGLSFADLNTPVPTADQARMGSTNIVRLVKGFSGNQGLLLSDDPKSALRTSILMHTFDAAAADGWTSPNNMPNSEGSIHVRPDDMVKLVEEIEKLGVTAHTNPTLDSTQGVVSVYVKTSTSGHHYMSNGVNEESSTEKFFKTTAGMAVGAVAIMFVLGVVGAAAMSKAGYQPELFRLSAERFSLIVGDRFSTVTGRASTTEPNPAGAETEMAHSRASENPVIATEANV